MDPRIHARFGDATRLLGDTEVTLIEHGPFAWLETKAVATFDVRALFFEDGKWVVRERNLDVFRTVLAKVRPPFDDDNLEHIVRAHGELTFDDALWTRADVEDLSDPRWYLFPVSGEAISKWHPPRIARRADGSDELVWFVHHFPHQAAMGRVRVDARYDVVVENVRDVPLTLTPSR